MRRDSVAVSTSSLQRPVLAVRTAGAREVDIPVVVGKPVSIGSSKTATIVVAGAGVAAMHAVVSDTSGQILLEDQQTPNGTSVNGQPVLNYVLNAGDVITLGDVTITLVDRAVTPPADDSPKAASGGSKILKLGMVGIGTAVLVGGILFMLAPAAPPPATDATTPPAATANSPAGGAPAPAPVGGGPTAPPPAAGPTKPASGPAPGSPAPAPSSAPGRAVVPAQPTLDVKAAAAALKGAEESILVRRTAANAVASGVDPVDALFDEGQSQRSAGRLRDASRLFAAALERRPNHPLARIRLNDTLRELDATITETIAEAERSAARLQYEDALNMWERVIELTEQGDPRAARARLGIDEARSHMAR
jgi:hypothetical protein